LVSYEPVAGILMRVLLGGHREVEGRRQEKPVELTTET